MTFPYLVEDGESVRCLCKGCGRELWREYARDGRRVRETRPEYGDLYLAMIDDAGNLSEHSTPCCPSCADAVRAEPTSTTLEAWWGADVFHWFIEERVLGKDPTTAYRVAMKLAGGRHPVRVRRYAPLT